MKDEIFTAKSYRFKRMRVFAAGGLVFVFLIAVIVRLAYVQIYDHARYVEYSRNMYTQKVTFSPTRGRILDRNGTPLALSVPMRSVFAKPSAIQDKRTVSLILSRDLGLSPDLVHQKLARRGHFVWLKRKVEDAEYETVKKRDFKGISSVAEDKRFYPQRTLAGRVIGFCGMDNEGLAGLEYLYDKTLSGEEMTIIAQRDAIGRIYGYNGAQTPKSNFELVTTLDSNIQYIAEKSVNTAYARYEAMGAVAIVMDVENGDLLAVAEAPGLDLNDPRAQPARHRSLSATQTYEPGSIFKVFVAAAAIEDGLATPDEMFDCENGRFEVYDRVIREANGKKYGMLPLKEVIAKSSNIGMIKLAQKMGPKRMYADLRKFGFGQKTKVDLPGENAGLMRDSRNWSGVSLAAVSFGQEITATPIQVATALSIIGNGGRTVRPHLFKQVMKDGRVVMEYRQPETRRVLRPETARQVIDMMLLTVTDGTGKLAQVSGFTVAGKTGTAQKYDHEQGRYRDDRPLASFIALFPAEAPRYAVLVMVDEPKGAGWGGEVAAPMAREIIGGMTQYMGMPARGQKHYEVDWSGVRQRMAAAPAAGYALPPVTMPASPASTADGGAAAKKAKGLL